MHMGNTMTGKLRIAVLQIPISAGSPDANYRLVEQRLAEAAAGYSQAGCDRLAGDVEYRLRLGPDPGACRRRRCPDEGAALCLCPRTRNSCRGRIGSGEKILPPI